MASETLIAVTDADGKTFDGTQWGECIASTWKNCGSLPRLYDRGVIVAYRDLALAGLMWRWGFGPRSHITNGPMRYWRAYGNVAVVGYGIQVGCRSLITEQEIEAPKITDIAMKAFLLLVALEMARARKWPPTIHERAQTWIGWATQWLRGYGRADVPVPEDTIDHTFTLELLVDNQGTTVEDRTHCQHMRQIAECVLSGSLITNGRNMYLVTGAIVSIEYYSYLAVMQEWATPIDFIALAREAVAIGERDE